MGFVHLHLAVEDADISRDVVVPTEITLAMLHRVIQEAFGWMDYHLHEFTKGGKRYSSDPQEDVIDEPALDSNLVTLGEVLKRKGATLDYVYDFGDWNEVTIKHMGTLKRYETALFAVHGPNMIEDCMGMGGMEEIQTIVKQKRSAKYKHLKAWLAEAFDRTPEEALAEPSVAELIEKVEMEVAAVMEAEEK